MKSFEATLGIDLGGSSLKWGVISVDGKLLFSGKEEIHDRSVRNIIQLLSKAINQALVISSKGFKTVGIGSPGLIDNSQKIVRVAPNFPEWKDVELVDTLKKQFSTLEIYLENDANLLLYSETKWGAAKGVKDIVILTLGTGVGGAVLTDGHVLRGTGGGAAELGHLTIDYNGADCNCGSKGCLEAYCNINGVMKTAEEVYGKDKSPSTPKEIANEAHNGSDQAIEVWRRVGVKLGYGIAALINIFNPEVILIGGGLSEAGEFLMNPARKTTMERCYKPSWEEVKVKRAGLREQAGIFGASAMAFARDNFFDHVK
jgi:glucokinase